MTVQEKAAQAAEFAGKSPYYAAGGTVIAGFALSEWAALMGILATLLTVVINWYYKEQHLKLARGQAQTDGSARSNDGD